MEHSRLQNRVYTREKQLTKKVDGNGILYNLVQDTDVSRYHILSAAEQRKEQMEVYDMQQKMMERQADMKKYYGGKTGTSNTTKTNSKEKETNAFTQALLTGKMVEGVKDKDSLRTILLNSEEVLEEEVLPTYSKDATHLGSWSQAYRKEQVFEPETAVEFTMDTIKGKFNQNLDIIEQLHREKAQMQAKIDMLEEQVVEARTASHGGIIYRRPHSARDGDHSPRSPRSPRSARGPHSGSGVATASSSSKLRRPSTAGSSSTTGRNRKGRGKEEEEEREQVRVVSAVDMAGMFDDLHHKGRSVDEYGPTQVDGNISKSLLASADKFKNRRFATEQRERDLIRAQAEYEEQLEERRLLASKGPPAPFQGVEKRYHAFKEKSDAKLEQLQSEQEAYYHEARQRFQRTLSEHVAKGVPNLDGRSYDDIMAKEEEERRVRIEKRKTETLLGSVAPVMVDLKTTNAERFRELYPDPTPFIAKDPKAVTERLEFEALRWTAKLERTKEAIREKEKEQREWEERNGCDPATRMEARAATVQAKRDQRLHDQQRKAEEKHAALVKRERAEMAGVMNAPVPLSGRRLTKAAEERTRINREKVLRQRLVEKNEAERREKERAASAPLRQNLQETVASREVARKAGTAGAFGTADERAAAAAAKNAQEYAERRKANKARIEASLSKRPSLMERHRQEMESQAAADRALGIVGDAMKGVTTVYPATSRGKENSNSSANKFRGGSHGESKHGGDDEGKYSGDSRDDDYYGSSSRDKERERGESKCKEKDDYDDYGYGDRRRRYSREGPQQPRAVYTTSDYRQDIMSSTEQTRVGLRDYW